MRSNTRFKQQMVLTLKESGFDSGGRKPLSTCQNDCLKGWGGATEQKQEGQGAWDCFHLSLMPDSQKIQTSFKTEDIFFFKGES